MQVTGNDNQFTSRLNQGTQPPAGPLASAGQPRQSQNTNQAGGNDEEKQKQLLAQILDSLGRKTSAGAEERSTLANQGYGTQLNRLA